MMDLPTLVGETVTLRAFKRSDAWPFRRWIRDEDLLRLVGLKVTGYPGIAEIIGRQHRLKKQPEVIEYMIVDNMSSEPIGDISIYGASLIARPTVAIMVAESRYRRSGYGSEALQLLLEYVDTHNRPYLYAEIYPFNLASQRFFEKNGFRNLGMIHDERKEECFLYKRNLQTEERSVTRCVSTVRSV